MNKVLVKLDNGAFALCQVLTVLTVEELAELKQNIDAALPPAPPEDPPKEI